MEKTYKGATGEQYSRLVIRNVTLINGLGTPAEGPVDILIEGDTITDINRGDPVALGKRGPDWKQLEGDHVIDATGMYVIPGLVDMHAHPPVNTDTCGPRGTEYVYKLWLAHGVTTLRTCGWSGYETLFEHRRLGEENKMVVPHLVVLQGWPCEESYTPEEAREQVRKYKELGADGIKFRGRGTHLHPDMIESMCDEVKKVGMRAGVATHIGVSHIDAAIMSNAGVQTIEHWYGIPQAAIPGTQHFPPGYNEMDELDRFRWAGHLWKEADQYPEEVVKVLDLLIKNSTIWDTTLVVYEANRDLGRAKTLEFHDRYTMPSLMEYWSPAPGHHASYHFDWKTSDEIAWKENFRIWMKYLKMFFERGGIITVGTDAGSLYAPYGFSTIRELELLQEVGIHPIDIIKMATTNAAKALGLKNLAGGVRKGVTADLAIVNGNPLDNFKVMYGAGLEKFSEDQTKKVLGGGVKWTIKGGVVFDAQALLRDVEDYVREMKG